MKTIKTRNVVKGTIKTFNGTIKTAEKTAKTVDQIKDSIGKIDINNNSGAVDTAPAAPIESVEQQVGLYTSRKTLSVGQKTFNSSIRGAVNVKRNIQFSKENIKAAESAIKSAKQTIKQGNKAIRTSIETGKASIKTAQASIKTTETAGKTTQMAMHTAKASARATAETARVTIQATKAAAQAAFQAMVATVKATGSVADGIGSAIAAGGWIVVVAILVVMIIVVIACSAFGIASANDTQGRTLSSVQQNLNDEFRLKIDEQKNSLIGFSKYIVRPAPSVTEWNNIIAVYSVRSQKEGNIPAEMTDKNVELLRNTLFDMVFFELSSEDISSTEKDEQTGADVTITEKYGVINIKYRSADEMAQKYSFNEDEKEMLTMMQEIQSETNNGIIISGNGEFQNPCPTGRWNGNDYPAYPQSGKYHAGRDISCPIGTAIYAASDGVIVNINDQSETYGNHIMIDHGNNVYTLYAHCDKLLVNVGDKVTKGQQIALSGDTGDHTVPHLHFEVRVGGKKYRINNVDPLDWIK